jgi:Ca-activated chloride channel family protein
MEDNELERLKHLSTPKPSRAAQRRAVEAGVAAFEDAQGKNAKASQGSAGLSRLSPVFIQQTWEFMMTNRAITGAALSSILIIPIAALFAFEQGWLERGPALVTTPPGQTKSQPVKSDPAKPLTTNKQLAAGPKREPVAADKIGRLDDRASRNEKRQFAAKPALPQIAKEAQIRPPAPAAVPQSRADVKQKLAVGRPMAAVRMKRMIGGRGVMSYRRPHVQLPPRSRDRFANAETNPVRQVAQHPVSTFSLDVDTTSYAFVRRMLRRGQMPPKAAVRIEEMVNYFPYDYKSPDNAEVPFAPKVTIYPTPWNQHTKLMHVAVKGFKYEAAKRPAANLVFLIDVSGSMSSPDRLPLLKTAFRLLVDRLGPDDTVSIVTYAGRSATVLKPTSGRDRHKILSALDNLRSGGSTAGAAGINQAYALAQQSFKSDGTNRVILATDGDFNVGASSVADLKRIIEDKRKSGVFLSVLGFGQGNLNDALMQALAQNGNGNAAYIDSLSEARKVLVEQAGATLLPIAKDVKIQIEFNPAQIAEYRLIGYQTRKLRREDFNNDKVDAGDVGSGHTVTAIYEITPVGAKRMVDGLRYQKPNPVPARASGDKARELGFLKLRYKLPKENKSRLITLPIGKGNQAGDIKTLSDDIRFATAVAAFGQTLRGSTRLDDYGLDDILKLAQSARGADRFGYRAEFEELVRLARALARPRPPAAPKPPKSKQ